MSSTEPQSSLQSALADVLDLPTTLQGGLSVETSGFVVIATPNGRQCLGQATDLAGGDVPSSWATDRQE
ncbi:MAG: hypothetical protein GY788_02220 [bacterium]|nr:hypothetical protein [bacterium]